MLNDVRTWQKGIYDSIVYTENRCKKVSHNTKTLHINNCVHIDQVSESNVYCKVKYLFGVECNCQYIVVLLSVKPTKVKRDNKCHNVSFRNICRGTRVYILKEIPYKETPYRPVVHPYTI